jgi:MFS family permease
VLVSGYVLAAATTIGFALLPSVPWLLGLLFVGSGIYIACEEVAEKALAVELLPSDVRGTGLGVLAATNGVGDFVSSALVGALWAAFPATPALGFAAAAALQLAGLAILGFAGEGPRTRR